MSPRRGRPWTARLGLLALAMLHVVAMAALPFTHRHLPSSIADLAYIGIEAPDDATGDTSNDTGTLPHDDSSCTVCRTLASVDVPVAVQPALAPAQVRPLAVTDALSFIAPSREHSSTQSRAPPAV